MKRATRCQRVTQLLIFACLLLSRGTTLRAQEARPPISTDEAAQQEGAESQSGSTNRPRYVVRRNHRPDGTGRFYMGREIAPVMPFGGGGGAWLERLNRDEEENLRALVEALELEPGMIVADIGAGTGRLSIPMAERVAPDGKVLAVDVQDEMLSFLSKKLKQLRIENVEPILGTPKSPKLDPESVDLALFVDVYHEFTFPYEMMVEISEALKPGGRAVLVEYRKEDPRVPIKPLHKMSQSQVKKEIGQAELRLRWKETIDVLPRQHIIVFEKVAREEAKIPAVPE